MRPTSMASAPVECSCNLGNSLMPAILSQRTVRRELFPSGRCPRPPFYVTERYQLGFSGSCALRMSAMIMAAGLLVFPVSEPVVAQPNEPSARPANARICLNTREIVSSRSRDGRTMLFKMRDGRQYLNHLHGYCPGLKFDGFSWVLHSSDERVCENTQTLRVLRSGEVCLLGRFEPIRPAP